MPMTIRCREPRHQTLQTTIDWSHDLLSGDERTLLRRLCVFAGRFTLEDVEGVCAKLGVNSRAQIAAWIVSSD
jgi:predicted ATPase